MITASMLSPSSLSNYKVVETFCKNHGVEFHMRPKTSLFKTEKISFRIPSEDVLRFSEATIHEIRTKFGIKEE